MDWRVALPADVFLVILDEAGLGVGDQLLSIEVTPSEKGSGVWQARIAGDETAPPRRCLPDSQRHESLRR